MIPMLLIFWFILSDQISLFFIIVSLISVVSVIIIDRKFFTTSVLFFGVKWGWVVFFSKLVKEVFLSTIIVLKYIWFKPEEVTPKFFWVESKVKNPVVYAISITLTPGTMSMHLKDGKIFIHSLTSEIAEDMQNKSLENIVLEMEE
jgi:multicomponent Na+:H+ antiporter subunit E